MCKKGGVPKRRAGHFVASALSKSNQCCSNLSKYRNYERYPGGEFALKERTLSYY